MMTRLLILLAAACVAQESELDLDGLPTYDSDSGAGKGDDANCTDASYRAFIVPYLRGEAAADANPCTWGNDASYRIWVYLVGEQLKPLRDRYTQAIQKRFQNQATREQVVAAGTLDDATRAKLAQLLAVKPAHAGKVGFGAWRDYAYEPALALAICGVGSQVLTSDAIDQLSRQIMPFEDEWLGFVERAQPEMTEPMSFAIWWMVVEASFRDTRSPLSTGTQEPIDLAYVQRLVTTRPAGGFDDDGASFQSAITAGLAEAFGTTSPKLAAWREGAKMQPRGGGPRSYKAWAVPFAAIAQDFNTRTRTAEQRELFQLIIAARPCGSGPEVDELAQRLTTGLASAGNDPSGTPLATLAVPVACP